MKLKFKPVDADCPRHHCLYGSLHLKCKLMEKAASLTS